MRTWAIAFLLVGGSCFFSAAGAATIYPSNNEQYLIELINRARAAPAAEAARWGISLNEGLPAGTISTAAQQPLAYNPSLGASVAGHNADMLSHNLFSHTGTGGSTPATRASAAGYSFQTIGENIAWTGTLPGTLPLNSTTLALHEQLFTDTTVVGRGHRVNMLNAGYREIGASVQAGSFQGYNSVVMATDFGSAAGNPFLTGVVYNDIDKDGFYSPTGEGYGSVLVTARRESDGATFSTQTWNSGGYSLQAPAGVYDLTFDSSTFGELVRTGISLGNQNVKVDIVTAAQGRIFYNTANPVDVDADGRLTPRDVLVTINQINSKEALPTIGAGQHPTFYYDSSGDGRVNAQDVLLVINAINAARLAGKDFVVSAGDSLASFAVSVGSAIPTPEPAAIGLGSVALGALTLVAARRKSARFFR